MSDGTDQPTTYFGGPEEPEANGPKDAASLPVLHPEQVPLVLRQSERFLVRRLLGSGGFGEVYLALDRQLSRNVALKVPRVERLVVASDREVFLREARAVAALRHSGIVTVHDVHSDRNGIFLVMEYIEGVTLAEHFQRTQVAFESSARLMIDIARAVAYAHEHGFTHRDLKPANILLDDRGQIRITDFGLAIHIRGQHRLSRDIAGTPAYMAPEQARGETHRLDGRTDIWSLGVILYWMLTGQRPFEGGSEPEIFDEILHREPRPLRQLRASVPRELDRICLRCLAKRMLDRYPTGNDLAEDLQHWLEQSPGNPPKPTVSAMADAPSAGTARKETPPNEASAKGAVVPKGLRAFDQHDADFFLSLLPGPFDRQGLPASIRFWRQQIEERDPAASFAIGLMYGPSGCGKTSLVRAGILPRLADRIRSIYIEAGASGTEERLRRALVRLLPALSPALSLVEMLIEVREGRLLRPDEKLLIVLDQFEQWLNANDIDENHPLVAALRHCDGGRLQCLVMVRDDFSMAATRFMNAVEVAIAEGRNCAAVDVFRRDHAKRVLRLFGEAFGQLSGEASPSSERFLDQAIALVAEGNMVTPVRLAAFAELTRRQDWTAATLRQLGDSQGLGVALLEGYLGDAITNPTHQAHRGAARRILEALMPDDRTSLKGRMRSRTELMVVAGYEDRPRDFEQLLTILDHELRLITPADPQRGTLEDSAARPDGSNRRERYYQLAHDYLVPALIVWLTGKQRATRQGRAELRLSERCGLWAVARDRRQLPSAWETGEILVLTRRSAWTAPQSAMMRRATRVHTLRLAAFAVIVGIVGTTGVLARRYVQAAARARDAAAVVDRLLVADETRLVQVLEQMDATFEDWRPRLVAVADDPSATHGERLRAHLALAPRDPSRLSRIVDALRSDGPGMIRAVRIRLSSLREDAAREAARRADESATTSSHRLRLAALAAGLAVPEDAWATHVEDVVQTLLSDGALDADEWADLFAPARALWTPALVTRFHDPTAGQSERVTAARILARLGSTELWVPLLLDADPAQFPLVLQPLTKEPDFAVPLLLETMRRPLEATTDDERLLVAKRQRNAAIALLLLGHPEELGRALEGGADATLRTLLMLSLRDYGVAAVRLLELEPKLTDPVARQGLWLALGHVVKNLPADRQLAVMRRAREQSALSTTHVEQSGIEWLLRQRDASAIEAAAESDAAPPVARDALVTSQGARLRVIRGPLEFQMGSPADEPRREPREAQHACRIDRSYAIGIHEVTVAEFRQFKSEFNYARDVSLTEDAPVTNVSWLDAVRFCRWLSEKEAIPPEQQCYPPLDQIGVDMVLPPDFLTRTGYRLPTEAEWEYACRAGTSTRWFFGVDEVSLPKFGWFIASSHERCWPAGTLLPNQYGLFDVLGNVSEWCNDPLLEYSGTPQDRTVDTGANDGHAVGGQPRVIRGGNYRAPPKALRSAQRNSYASDMQFSILGFRLARTVLEPATSRTSTLNSGVDKR